MYSEPSGVTNDAPGARSDGDPPSQLGQRGKKGEYNMSNQNNTASGNYEFTFHGIGDSTLQIFSSNTMSSSMYRAQEVLDLLHFLQSHEKEIEERAKLEAQQPKQPKSRQERINDLFR